MFRLTFPVIIFCFFACSGAGEKGEGDQDPELQYTLIGEGQSGGVDGVSLGDGRNDDVLRLYLPVTYSGYGY